MKKIYFMACLIFALILLASCATASISQPETPETEISGTASPTTEPNIQILSETTPEIGIENERFGAIQVTGTKLTDSDGATIQLRGISSHGLSWFPEYVNYDMMKQMRDEWGCNVFRIAMYTAEYNGYCVGDETNRALLKERIHTAVVAAEELGMYLVIDWHILSDNSPQQYQEEAILFFGEIAKKYKDETHILYEICNEPNGETTWAEIKDYAQKVIPIIREHTDAVILVGTPTWSQEIDKAAQSPITGYENIMYTLHFYAATHTDGLRERMVKAVESGLPVFVSEFGICDASGNGAIDEAQADQWLEVMNKNDISFIMWNLSNKDESSAMIVSTCTKVSNISYDDLSQAGRWFVDRQSNFTPEDFTTPPSITQEVSPANSEDVLVLVQLENSWNDSEEIVYQFNLEISNQSDTDLSAWNVVIAFNQDVILRDHWNGHHATDGNTLTITPEEYNKVIQVGSQVTGIGFQVAADSGLTVVSAQNMF